MQQNGCACSSSLRWRYCLLWRCYCFIMRSIFILAAIAKILIPITGYSINLSYTCIPDQKYVQYKISLHKIYTELIGVLTMVILAFSWIILTSTLMPEFLIIPFRFCASSMASYYEAKRWRFAPFSDIKFLFSEKKNYDIVNILSLLQIHYKYSDTQNSNQMTCEVG